MTLGKAFIAVAAILWCMTQAAEAKSWADCSGLPCVDIEPGLTMVIDTGNPLSVLNAPRAKELGLALSPFVNRHGQTVSGYSEAHLQNVKVAGVTIPDVKFLVADLSKNIADGTFPKVDGTIGYSVLKGYTLSLDYKQHTVALGSGDASCAAACGAITYPPFGEKGPPIVVTSGFRVNGKDVSMQVDTFYTGTMLIFPTSVAKLRLKAEALSPRADHFFFTDGGVDMIRGRAESESFGDTVLAANAPLYFATPKVHTPDGLFDGTVGAALFAGHVVNLDFHANRFWME